MWEYQILGLEDLMPNGKMEELQRKLDELGQQEWELITVTTIGFSQSLQLWIFKKPKASEGIVSDGSICKNCCNYDVQDKNSGICYVDGSCVNMSGWCENHGKKL